jgi:polysaccharide export outer membrane protein
MREGVLARRSFGGRAVRFGLLALCAPLLVTGCGALPAAGPEERDILRSERTQANQLGFHIVPVDARTTAVLAEVQARPFDSLGRLGAPARTDTIGPGDELAISVFEIGSGLFAGGGTAPAAEAQPGSAGISTAATRENLPTIAVDARGDINVPYIGLIHAGGHTPEQVGALIEAGLRSHSQDPQVVVTVSQNIANTVIVAGDVNKPGRVPLSLARERLLDVIALAGGPTHPAQDMVVVLTRRGHSGEARLNEVQTSDAANVAMWPQDRVRLIDRPRTYTVFGATHVAETPLDADRVSLAEAVARAGGPLDERADPNAVFLFRYEAPGVAERLGVAAGDTGSGIGGGPSGGVPIIYHLDMIQTDSYFLAQKFPMRDKDVIYIANARTDALGKFLGLISGLFTPAIITRSLQQ